MAMLAPLAIATGDKNMANATIMEENRRIMPNGK
jgi:hypothetical protein